MTVQPVRDPELTELLANEPGLLAVADALAEAHRTDRVPRFATRGRHRLAAALAATMATLAIGGVAAASFGSLFAGSPVAPAALSGTDWATLTAASHPSGRPMAPAANLRAAGVASINQIANRSGRSFFVINRLNGAQCFATGTQGGVREGLDVSVLSILGTVDCPSGKDAFPSQVSPVLDMSVFHGDLAARTGVGTSFVSRLTGFAADGIATVAVVDTTGVQRVSSPVIDNVYVATDLPPFAPQAIVAYDATGKEVWRQCVALGGCG